MGIRRMKNNIIVIIPTKNRPKLLKRAIQSVSNQTAKPDKLIIICDSNKRNEVINRKLVESYSTKLNILFLKCARTRNLSGSINTALIKLLELNINPGRTYLALLDDDDWWDSSYLSTCLHEVKKDKLDWAISGIIRHESKEPIGKKLNIPTELRINDFYKTNPNIQGSSLFIRFSKLLECGGFDESLESTTDRDVCIRLLFLGDTKYGIIKKHLVHHMALSKINRLSSPGSKAKKQGLQTFYRKYGPLMSNNDRLEFKKRALELFNCEINETFTGYKKMKKETNNFMNQSSIFNIPIIIGFIVTDIRSTKNLLNDILSINKNIDLIKRVFLLDNTNNTQYLESLISKKRFSKLDIVMKPRYDINNEAKNGDFGDFIQILNEYRDISINRTILHHYLYLESLKLPGSVIWILDDDVRLDYILPDGNKKRLEPQEIYNEIKRLKEEKIDIAIGGVTGVPSIPTLSMLRVQLLDLVYHIKYLLNNNTEFGSVDESFGLKFKKDFPDFYYDNSSLHFNHLEIPLWKRIRNIPNEQRILQILDDFQLITKGRNPFRPVIWDNQKSLKDRHAMVVRGANTLVLNNECLNEFPNISPFINGLLSRRGDTIWLLLNEYIGKYNISRSELNIRHNRVLSPNQVFSFKKLTADFYGSSFIRALNVFFKEWSLKNKDLDFYSIINNRKELEKITEYFDYYLKEKILLFKFNSYRIRGLLKTLKNTLNKDQYNKIRKTIDLMETTFTDRNVNNFIRELKKYNNNEILEFIKELPDNIRSYKENLDKKISQSFLTEHDHNKSLSRLNNNYQLSFDNCNERNDKISTYSTQLTNLNDSKNRKTDFYRSYVPCLHRVFNHRSEIKDLTPHWIQYKIGFSMSVHSLQNRLIQLISRLRNKNKLKSNEKILVTFDDGYKDVLLMREFFRNNDAFQPVVFISSSIMDKGYFYWFDRYYRLLSQLNGKKIDIKYIKSDLNFIYDPGHNYANILQLASGNLKNELRASLNEDQQKFLNYLFSRLDVQDLQNNNGLYITSSDIRALSKDGWIIASHGKFHHDMRVLSKTRVKAELQESLDAILNLGGRAWLAFPDGKWNNNVKRISKEVGYTKLFTINPNKNILDPDTIGREIW